MQRPEQVAPRNRVVATAKGQSGSAISLVTADPQ